MGFQVLGMGWHWVLEGQQVTITTSHLHSQGFVNPWVSCLASQATAFSITSHPRDLDHWSLKPPILSENSFSHPDNCYLQD